MKFVPFTLAWRYLRYTSREKTISSMIIISGSAIALATACLLLVLSIMAGFEKETHKTLQGIHNTLTMHARGQHLDYKKMIPILSKDFPEITGITPCTYSPMMIEQKKDTLLSNMISFKAIVPSLEQESTKLSSLLIDSLGKNNSLPDLLTNNQILIGHKLVKSLHTKLGKTITLVYPAEEQRKRNYIALEKAEVIVAGIFKTGIDELDSEVIIGSLSFLQSIMPESDITFIGLNSSDKNNVTNLIQRLKKRFGVSVYSWQQLYPALVSALILEKYASFLVIVLMVLLACMTIIAVLYMHIQQKRGDIAILRSIGTPSKTIRLIFIWMGMFICSISTLIGLLFGYAIGFLLKRFIAIDLPDVYVVPQLPIDLNVMHGVIVGIVVVGISFITCLMVSRSIQSISIADTLRFDS